MTSDLSLHNLELHLDVLEDDLNIPMAFEISRGFIKELKISIPWTRLLSQPIEITLKCVEVILTAKTKQLFLTSQEKVKKKKSALDSKKEGIAFICCQFLCLLLDILSHLFYLLLSRNFKSLLRWIRDPPSSNQCWRTFVVAVLSQQSYIQY